MKSVVLLLSALAALSSAGPLDVRSSTEWTTESDLNGSPNITVNVSLGSNPRLQTNQFRQQKEVQSSPGLSEGESFLEWVTWKNSLPNNAVSIYNDDVGRTDYVCKYKCHAGFYTPTKGSFCYYANEGEEHAGFPFEILVNKDSFEVLEWKDASRGSVPKNSVRTCPVENIHVGKNQYGLGKVDTDKKLFYLPWEGYAYEYFDHQVLTVNKNIVSQQIDNVRYITNGSEITKYPPEIIRESTIKNLQCHPVERTDTVTKTYEVAQTWDFGFSITTGVKTTFTVGVPLIVEEKIEVGLETTLQLTKETTVTESVTDTVSVQLKVPPSKSCSLNMIRYKKKLTIPFTARLRRTYGNGEIRTMFFSGTYKSVQVAKMEVLLDSCQLVENPQPCA